MRHKRSIAARLSTVLFLVFTGLTGTAFAGVPVNGGIGFQEPATPVMESLVSLHNGLVLPIIIFITIFVLVLMAYILFRFSEKRNPVPSKTAHNTYIEIAWTIIPVIILLVMVGPSMQLLYQQDRIPEADLTLKVTGNTWNWEYAYVEHENIEPFISNVLEKDDAVAAGKPYLLGTDAPLVVPVNKTVAVRVTSSNNLHSFAVPAFGVKIDAIPGKINQTWFRVNPGKEGTFYGQCSELCGIRHAYMPIEIEVVSQERFDEWVRNDGAFTTQISQNSGGGQSTLQE